MERTQGPCSCGPTACPGVQAPPAPWAVGLPLTPLQASHAWHPAPYPPSALHVHRLPSMPSTVRPQPVQALAPRAGRVASTSGDLPRGKAATRCGDLPAHLVGK